MKIKKNRGFKLGRKLIRVFKWVTQKRVKSYKYEQLEGQTFRRSNAIAKLREWGKSIRRGFFNSGNRGYIRVDHDPVMDKKRVQVPKGYLAVYVGEGENEARRVLVPVLFLNHPLFGKLLNEAEEVFGFDHPGRITIPCPLSEFENVKTEIAAGEKYRPWMDRHGYVPGIRCLSL